MATQTTTSVHRRTKSKSEVLSALAEFYCLRPKDLAYLSRKRQPTESDIRSINATLKLLREENLVYRIRYSDPTFEYGATTFVYGLNRPGARLLEEPRAFDEHSIRTIDHELEISLFHIALKELCETHGWELIWHQDGVEKGRDINPDAFFVIVKPELPKERNAFPFFLEMERAKFGNMRNGLYSIERKLTKYHKFFDTAECESVWNVRKFRIAIVQPTETRRASLLDLMQTDKLNHRMFWLTTEELYRATIGGSIWRTPKDTEKYSFFAL